MSGWIKLHRQIMDNPLYFSEPFSRTQAWIDLLILANHKEGYFFKRGIKVTVSIGQVGYDMDSLAKRWQWSRGKVERFISHLENEGNIVRQKNNVTTLLSIVKYKEYQADSKAEDKPKSKANGHQTVKQTDTNNNDKNDNNEKELLNNTYQLCVDFWLKEFHTDFTFNSTAGNKLKSIIKKFETLLKNNGKEISVSTLFESFKIMCQKLPEWYKNKDLSVIDSKFNEIIQEIKNGTNSKQEQRKDAAAEAIRLLTGTELR